MGSPGSTTAITVKVLSNALIHTPTNDNLGTPDVASGVTKLGSGALPGRTEQGFKGGTVIISGDSLAGIIYAEDVFTDLFEHVVVGEATTSTNAGYVGIQNLDLVKSTDPRMPAGKPINIYGFEIDPTKVVPGTLVSAEGYVGKHPIMGDALFYHTIEADAAELLRGGQTEVSILRADCRIRGGGRDEVSVRGGVHPATGSAAITGTVAIERLDAVTGAWVRVGVSGAALPDPATTPVQSEYRYDSSRLNLGGRCPGLLRAVYPSTVGATGTVTDVKAPDIR
jgi:hypothetical protein